MNADERKFVLKCPSRPSRRNHKRENFAGAILACAFFLGAAPFCGEYWLAMICLGGSVILGLGVCMLIDQIRSEPKEPRGFDVIVPDTNPPDETKNRPHNT